MATQPDPKSKTYWLDNPRNVDRLVHAFYAICAVLIAIDVFVPKHGAFAVEHVLGFTAGSASSPAWFWSLPRSSCAES